VIAAADPSAVGDRFAPLVRDATPGLVLGPRSGRRRAGRTGSPMQFALFYEIPVARPWDRDSEHRALLPQLRR
jgi:hypothetical protein